MIPMTKFYKICEVSANGVCPIQITRGKFNGIKYAYGRVAIEELEDNAKLSFEYDIFDGVVDENSIEEFKKMTGDILKDILIEQLDSNEVIYTGGTDGT